MRWSWISLLIIGSLEAASVTPVDGKLIKGPVQLAADGVRVGDIIVPWNNVRQAIFTEPERPAKRAVVSEGQLPAGWHSKDIGHLRGQGSSVFKDGQWTLQGFSRSPEAIPHAHKDRFRLAYIPMKGDGQITARVTGMTQKARVGSIAGVCFRSGTTHDERNAQMALTYRGGLRFRTYGMRGGSGRSTSDPKYSIPGWVRLERRDRHILGSWSADGQNWTVFHVGNTWKFDEEYVAGLFVIAHGEEAVKVTFDHVKVERTDQQPPFTPRLVLRNGTELVSAFTSVNTTHAVLGAAPGHNLRTEQLAYLVLHPDFRPEKLPANRPGVLLRRGDFFDGELVKLSDGELSVNSILFGPRTFNVATEVLAVALADVRPGPAMYTVKTQAGSHLRATALREEQGRLRATVPGMGILRLTPRELHEVRRLEK